MTQLRVRVRDYVDQNPYGDPVSGSQPLQPASAGRRIAACLINIVPLLLAFLPFYAAVWDAYSHHQQTVSAVLVRGFLLSLLFCFAVTAWQWRGLGKEGQSFGKKVMKIRVSALNGKNPGFAGTVVIRELVFGFLLQAFGGAVSMVCSIVFSEWFASGTLAFPFYPTNALLAGIVVSGILCNLPLAVCFMMLFRKKTNCRTLQDYLAGTVVVRC